MKLSIVIITYNEENNIRDCLESVKSADEIIIIDGFSTDKTVEICKKYTNNIYQRKNTSNLNVNKSYGFEKATCDWILYLDADERVSSELTEEIRELLSRNQGSGSVSSKFVAYKMPRKNFYFGRWLRYGGHYPDNQLRLFIRGKAHLECLHVHERLQVNGKIGLLHHPLIHHSYPTISQYIKKFDFYTNFEAEYLFQNRKRCCVLHYLIVEPGLKFIRKYVFKFGFLDGVPGFLACIFHSLGIIVTYGKYWQRLKVKREKG